MPMTNLQIKAWNLECASTGMRSYPGTKIREDAESLRIEQLMADARANLPGDKVRKSRRCSACGKSFMVPLAHPEQDRCLKCR